MQLLEEYCGRGAVLAGTIESYAGSGVGLSLDGGMTYDLCEDQRCCVKRQVSVPDRSDYRRVSGALLWDGGEASSRVR